MTHNRPHPSPDAAQAAAACGDFILDALRQAVNERGRATLAVSGGKTPKLMFERMRQAPFPWKQLQFFFVDERAVPPDDPESNYHLAQESFLGPLQFPAENVFRIEGELLARDAAEKYEQTIRETFGLTGSDMPVFDVIHHGMGPDGHTASLFPGQPLIEDRIGIAAAVTASKAPHERVTLLPGVLVASRTSLFLIDGGDKQEALNQVLLGEKNVMQFPSQLVALSGKQVEWFFSGLEWPPGTA